jgi:4-hydroxy-3-polyprenylbenzoate decarboxylase
MKDKKTITVALTGASGMAYGMRLLEILLQQEHRVYLLYSQAAQIVTQHEMALTLSSRPKETEAFLNNYFKVQPGLLTVFGREEWFAPVASGSNPADAMAVCPCTMGT